MFIGDSYLYRERKLLEYCKEQVYNERELTFDDLSLLKTLKSGYICSCKDGFVLDFQATFCVDVNECQEETDNCHQHANCVNTEGSFDCACKNGFNGDGHTCEDIDECWFDPCDVNAECTNYDGGFKCECNQFYSGDGLSCEDSDECALVNN